ncbi:hypothetical protein LTR62_005912 [Meristemomyces frigidus]|uniref:Peptidase A1 domain-containing protein n=1 Tax=Meristemomyces frigidus TaxID=1508187 RepID=A0AAN7THW9_9PEZI|nr:hypothetical protein LTR62_005912 [Meristemomyces frigidus]
MAKLNPHASEATNHSSYSIIPDEFLLKRKEETWFGYEDVNENPGTNFPVIVDSGTTLGELGEDPETGGCTIGIQPMDGVYILGDEFLKNVVAVFDVGAGEMGFARHEY